MFVPPRSWRLLCLGSSPYLGSGLCEPRAISGAAESLWVAAFYPEPRRAAVTSKTAGAKRLPLRILTRSKYRRRAKKEPRAFAAHNLRPASAPFVPPRSWRLFCLRAPRLSRNRAPASTMLRGIAKRFLVETCGMNHLSLLRGGLRLAFVRGRAIEPGNRNVI
jgi:hypothetical protein